MLPLLAILVSVPLVVVLLHAILQRVSRGAPPQRVAINACLWGAVPAAIALLAAGARDAVSLLYAAVVYGCVVYSYFHVFNMSETARRIRLVREIDRRGRLSDAQIASAYSDDEVVDTRLSRMMGMRQLRESNGRYFVASPILLFAARVLDGWRNVLGYDRGPVTPPRGPQ